MRKDANRLRKRLGLPPIRDLMEDGWPSHRLNLIASSPALLDRPADWPPWHQMCGFLALPPNEHEPVAPDVEAFLSRGPAPVFMGFGSLMPLVGSDHLMDAIAILSKRRGNRGQRAIIQTDLERPPTDDVVFVKRTPHAQVFPRCAAVVHHAGAGTTHSTLRAGVPSITVPHIVRSVRVVGRSATAWRRAGPAAPHEMERERAGGAHSTGGRQPADEGGGARDSETHGVRRWSGDCSEHD